MSDMFAHVTIRILEKEYHVACPAEEKAALLESAELLNGKMREIRDSGKIAGAERIAVMAALNLAHDLLRERHAPRAGPSAAMPPATIDDNALRRRIVSMQSAIDQVLAGQENAR